MPDIKRMISEVAAENGIRVEPGDPLFALVTINRMVLEESAKRYYEYNQKLIAEFKESMKKTETRAGDTLAEKVKEAAEKIREGLQGDIQFAGMRASEYVHRVNEAHRRPAIIRWVSVGLMTAAGYSPPACGLDRVSTSRQVRNFPRCQARAVTADVPEPAKGFSA